MMAHNKVYLRCAQLSAGQPGRRHPLQDYAKERCGHHCGDGLQQRASARYSRHMRFRLADLDGNVVRLRGSSLLFVFILPRVIKKDGADRTRGARGARCAGGTTRCAGRCAAGAAASADYSRPSDVERLLDETGQRVQKVERGAAQAAKKTATVAAEESKVAVAAEPSGTWGASAAGEVAGTLAGAG